MDINDINLSLSVNGETRQNGNTKNMIFNISYLISHISKYLTLNPGAVISTGTPAGTGMEQKPQKFLQVGDKLHLKIDGLGEQINEIIADWKIMSKRYSGKSHKDRSFMKKAKMTFKEKRKFKKEKKNK